MAKTLLFDEILETETYYKKGPRSPFAWYGGKFYYAKWIVEHFCDHRVYIEPFGGAANILFNKAPSEVEIFNDLDDRVINFFRVLRDKKSYNELIRLLNLTPYSRKEFNNALEVVEEQDPVKKAWAFFVRCRQAIGGLGMSKLTGSSWAMSLRTRRKMAEPVSKYLSSIEGLQEIAERFRSVVIENMDAAKLIKKYDCKDALIYCDPPYLPETRHGQKGNTYAFEMTYEEHSELLKILKKCRGHVIISGYHSELYDELLSDWSRATVEGKSHIANSGQKREEVLWMNW
ncbi:MAG: DNA adenine methylase [Balneolaceae bacterium]|nr:DNA adenine methylase [Balneolaceae bacterium]